MTREYVEQRDRCYYLAGTRITLDSVVYGFKDGRSPEDIQSSFPTLQLSEVYGAIAFYLDHQAAIDQYLEEGQREMDALCVPLSQENPALWERLQRARAKMGEPQS